MKSDKGTISIDAPYPGAERSVEAPGALKDSYRCRLDEQGNPIRHIGQPALFVFVSRDATIPAGGNANQQLYAKVTYTYNGKGGTIEYDVTNGGRFAIPPCDEVAVTFTLRGFGGPVYTWEAIVAWEQPSTGAAGFYTTRPIALAAATETVANVIPVPPGMRAFFAEGTDPSVLGTTEVRKYTADGTLISMHVGAEDTMPVSGNVAYITYKSANAQTIRVNFIPFYS